jgi:ATP-binding cassette subfamily G (WHITE) protein 1
VEIITKPSILFLDEPTSGLDSFAAYVVVNILKDLAMSGCTVLCTIHQPSSEVFHLFDRVLLLSEGRTLYDDTVHHLCAHLDSLGLAVPEETNPADHIMFLMQTLEKEQLGTICDNYEAGRKIDPHTVPPEVASASAHLDGGLARRQAGMWTQFVVLGVREAQNVIRDKAALGARFGVAIMLHLLFGLLFLNIGDTSRSDYNITSHFGALVMVGVSGMMGAAQVSHPRPHLVPWHSPLTPRCDCSRSCCCSRRSGRGLCASTRRGHTARQPTSAPSS